MLVLAASSLLASEHPRLSRTRVLRIADLEVRNELRDLNLREFQAREARYFADEQKWIVIYRRIGQRYADFDVEIDDATKTAAIWMP